MKKIGEELAFSATGGESESRLLQKANLAEKENLRLNVFLLDSEKRIWNGRKTPVEEEEKENEEERADCISSRN